MGLLIVGFGNNSYLAVANIYNCILTNIPSYIYGFVDKCWNLFNMAILGESLIVSDVLSWELLAF